MKFSEQKIILIHDTSATEVKKIADLHGSDSDLYAISNNHGIFAYFTSRELAFNFANFIAITSKRIQNLNPDDLETIHNELDLIHDEMKEIFNLNR